MGWALGRTFIGFKRRLWLSRAIYGEERLSWDRENRMQSWHFIFSFSTWAFFRFQSCPVYSQYPYRGTGDGLQLAPCRISKARLIISLLWLRSSYCRLRFVQSLAGMQKWGQSRTYWSVQTPNRIFPLHFVCWLCWIAACAHLPHVFGLCSKGHHVEKIVSLEFLLHQITLHCCARAAFGVVHTDGTDAVAGGDQSTPWWGLL